MGVITVQLVIKLLRPSSSSSFPRPRHGWLVGLRLKNGSFEAMLGFRKGIWKSLRPCVFSFELQLQLFWHLPAHRWHYHCRLDICASSFALQLNVLLTFSNIVIFITVDIIIFVLTFVRVPGTFGHFESSYCILLAPSLHKINQKFTSYILTKVALTSANNHH